MRNGGEEEFNQMVKLYETADMPEDKVKALYAIGLSKDPTLIKRAIV